MLQGEKVQMQRDGGAVSIGVLLLVGVLLLAASAATAQQPVEPDRSAPPLVGPFLVRDLLKLLDADPFDAEAARLSVTATAIRSARELGRRRTTFGLTSSWVSARPRSARQTAARDARWAWHDTYMRMIWRSIRR